MRSSLSSGAAAARPAAPTPPAEMAHRMRIAFRAVDAMGKDPTTALAARILTERLTRHFVDQGVFTVVEETEDAGPVPADVTILTRAARSGAEIALFLSVRSENHARVIASYEISVDTQSLTGVTYQIRAAQLSDQITRTILRADMLDKTGRFQATRHLLTGIDSLFRISTPDLALAEREFVAAAGLDESGVALAWLAYLRAFRFEKAFREKPGAAWDDYQDLAARAQERGPNSPVVAALLAHVHGFVGRDYPRAFSLLEPFESSARDNLMLQDSLAMFRFYTGRLDAAARHAALAAQLGRNSPYRFLFSTSLAMIALAQGRLDESIRHGEAALAQHPSRTKAYFEPVLRTLLAAYAHAGDRANVSRILGIFRQQDPDFTTDALKDHESAPIPNFDFFEIIRTGANKATREE